VTFGSYLDFWRAILGVNVTAVTGLTVFFHHIRTCHFLQTYPGDTIPWIISTGIVLVLLRYCMTGLDPPGQTWVSRSDVILAILQLWTCFSVWNIPLGQLQAWVAWWLGLPTICRLEWHHPGIYLTCLGSPGPNPLWYLGPFLSILESVRTGCIIIHLVSPFGVVQTWIG